MGVSTRFFAGTLLAFAASLASASEYTATLIENSRAWGSVVADFNNDGHDDIYITGHDKNDRIWYWTANGYVPSKQVFKWTDRHDCDAADFNHDGLMDMYCAVGAEQGTGEKANEFWVQNANGTHRKGKGWGAKDPNGRSRRPQFFDLNNDGFADLFDTNYAEPREDGKTNINRVYLNRSGKGFDEVQTLATGAHGSLCVDKGDINHDGWDDLVICNIDGLGHLYLNDKNGNFVELAPKALREPWLDAKLVDMNHDGWDDLVVTTASNVFQIWLNNGKRPFFDHVSLKEQMPFGAVALAIGDFNHDHWMDVYVVLRDADCHKTGHDLAPDVIYHGRPFGRWVRKQLVQDYAGCGHGADVVDGDKILLMNGGGNYVGPNYIIQQK